MRACKSPSFLAGMRSQLAIWFRGIDLLHADFISPNEEVSRVDSLFVETRSSAAVVVDVLDIYFHQGLKIMGMVNKHSPPPHRKRSPESSRKKNPGSLLSITHLFKAISGGSSGYLS